MTGTHAPAEFESVRIVATPSQWRATAYNLPDSRGRSAGSCARRGRRRTHPEGGSAYLRSRGVCGAGSRSGYRRARTHRELPPRHHPAGPDAAGPLRLRRVPRDPPSRAPDAGGHPECKERGDRRRARPRDRSRRLHQQALSPARVAGADRRSSAQSERDPFRHPPRGRPPHLPRSGHRHQRAPSSSAAIKT